MTKLLLPYSGLNFSRHYFLARFKKSYLKEGEIIEITN